MLKNKMNIKTVPLQYILNSESITKLNDHTKLFLIQKVDMIMFLVDCSRSNRAEIISSLY